MLSAFLALVFGVGFSVWSANRIANASGDRAVCDVIKINLDAYKEAPPQTPLGKVLQGKYTELYKKC